MPHAPPSSAKPSGAHPRRLESARLWVIGLLVGLLLGSAGALLLPCSAGEPEAPPLAALQLGHDACAYCRMVVGQVGFAARLRHPDGREATYDDIGCLVRALESAAVDPSQVDLWVEDHEGGGWVTIDHATLVELPAPKGGTVTPMGYGVLGFANAKTAEAFATSEKGTTVTIEGLCTALRAKYNATIAN